MSHVTEVTLKVRDLDALDKACEALGLELRRDKTTFAWWGTFVGDSTPPVGRDPKDYGTCDHAIGIKGETPRMGSNGPWEIGVVKALDGDGYTLMLDEYGVAGRRLRAACGGPELNGLRREYAAAVAETQARRLARQGFALTRENLPGGRIKLRLRSRR